MATMEPVYISTVPRNFWGQRPPGDILGVILTINGRVFFGDFQVHENAGLGNCDPMHE